MKQWIRISLFITLIAIIIFVEIFMRSIPNSYKFKNKWMKANADEVELLVLGTSSAYYGINPAYISLKSFNLANMSQDLSEDSFILNKYKKKEKKIKYVIEVMSDASLLYTMQSGIESWREDYYGIYMGYPKKLFAFEINNEWMPRKLKAYLRGDDMLGCNEYGFGTAYKLVNKPTGDNMADIEAAKRHTFLNRDGSIDTVNLAANKKHLEDIISFCKDKNAHLFIVAPPSAVNSWSRLNPKQVALFHSNVSEFINKYPGVVSFKDYTKDKRFVEDDFYDSGHLSDVGAQKFTKIICDELLR